MRCKQCGEPFSKTEAYDVYEMRRQYVQPEQGGQSWHVHLEDAGVFCSRNCLRDHLRSGDRSGVFAPKPPPA
jgi:hypothetical protein